MPGFAATGELAPHALASIAIVAILSSAAVDLILKESDESWGRREGNGGALSYETSRCGVQVSRERWLACPGEICRTFAPAIAVDSLQPHREGSAARLEASAHHAERC